MTDETPKPAEAKTREQAAVPAAPAEDPGRIVMPTFICSIVLATLFSFAVDGISKYYPATPRAKPSITGKATLAPK
jgi:hypothetical protein